MFLIIFLGNPYWSLVSQVFPSLPSMVAMVDLCNQLLDGDTCSKWLSTLAGAGVAASAAGAGATSGAGAASAGAAGAAIAGAAIAGAASAGAGAASAGAGAASAGAGAAIAGAGAASASIGSINQLVVTAVFLYRKSPPDVVLEAAKVRWGDSVEGVSWCFDMGLK